MLAQLRKDFTKVKRVAAAASEGASRHGRGGGRKTMSRRERALKGARKSGEGFRCSFSQGALPIEEKEMASLVGELQRKVPGWYQEY